MYWRTMETIAVYPGTFDPFTLGHLDIVLRASRIFQRVIILIAHNPRKKPMFTIQERESMIEEALAEYAKDSVFNWLKNTIVATHEGLLADYIRELYRMEAENTPIVIRGLRAVSDFEHEFQMAHTNRSLSASFDTIFIPTSLKYFFVSSSTVREIFSFGGNISEFVPKCVVDFMTAKAYREVVQKIPGIKVQDTATWCHTCNPGLKKE